jgi:hypothetical protein
LAWHDEGAADVTVLDETFAIFDIELEGDLLSRSATGVRHGDHHVDVVVRPFSQDLLP